MGYLTVAYKIKSSRIIFKILRASCAGWGHCSWLATCAIRSFDGLCGRLAHVVSRWACRLIICFTAISALPAWRWRETLDRSSPLERFFPWLLVERRIGLGLAVVLKGVVLRVIWQIFYWRCYCLRVCSVAPCSWSVWSVGKCYRPFSARSWTRWSILFFPHAKQSAILSDRRSPALLAGFLSLFFEWCRLSCDLRLRSIGRCGRCVVKFSRFRWGCGCCVCFTTWIWSIFDRELSFAVDRSFGLSFSIELHSIFTGKVCEVLYFCLWSCFAGFVIISRGQFFVSIYDFQFLRLIFNLLIVFQTLSISGGFILWETRSNLSEALSPALFPKFDRQGYLFSLPNQRFFLGIRWFFVLLFSVVPALPVVPVFGPKLHCWARLAVPAVVLVPFPWFHFRTCIEWFHQREACIIFSGIRYLWCTQLSSYFSQPQEWRWPHLPSLTLLHAILIFESFFRWTTSHHGRWIVAASCALFLPYGSTRQINVSIKTMFPPFFSWIGLVTAPVPPSASRRRFPIRSIFYFIVPVSSHRVPRGLTASFSFCFAAGSSWIAQSPPILPFLPSRTRIAVLGKRSMHLFLLLGARAQLRSDGCRRLPESPIFSSFLTSFFTGSYCICSFRRDRCVALGRYRSSRHPSPLPKD